MAPGAGRFAMWRRLSFRDDAVPAMGACAGSAMIETSRGSHFLIRGRLPLAGIFSLAVITGGTRLRATLANEPLFPSHPCSLPPKIFGGVSTSEGDTKRSQSQDAKGKNRRAPVRQIRTSSADSAGPSFLGNGPGTTAIWVKVFHSDPYGPPIGG